MSDFDWIGIEWVVAGYLILLFATLSAITALTIWLIDRSRAKRESAQTK